MQALAPDRRREALTYYHETGPFGQAWQALPRAASAREIAVVGLGVGTLATYARPGAALDVLRNRSGHRADRADARYFSFMDACGDRCRVVIGDARISLGRVPEHTYDFLVLDAFSSDSIPMHLMTREAFSLYLSRLAPDGVLAMHISNRHLRLAPVVARLAASQKLVAMHQLESIGAGLAGRQEPVALGRDGAQRGGPRRPDERSARGLRSCRRPRRRSGPTTSRTSSASSRSGDSGMTGPMCPGPSAARLAAMRTPSLVLPLGLLAIVSLTAAPSPPQAQEPTVDPAAAMHWRHIGPTRAGRARARRRRAEPAQRLLHRLRQRRRLALHRLRRQLAADLRPRVHRLDRRDRGGAVRSERHLCRHRRRHHPSRSGDRQRRLQVHRRRQDVDAPRPLRQPDDRDDRRRSREIRTGCSSRSLGHPYGPNAERGIFRSTDGGKTLREGALQGRVHERQRRADRSAAIRTSSMRRSGSSSRASSKAAASAARGGGHLQVHRRRHDLEAADAGAPAGHAGEPDDLAEQSEDPLRHRRRRGAQAPAADAAAAATTGIYKSTDGGEHWFLAGPRRRRQRHARARQPPARAHRRRRSADAHGRSEERERRLQLLGRVLAHRGRRRHLVGGARRARRRRLPEGLDQSRTTPNIILAVSDQGAVVSATAASRWSNWYNQPTAAMYHVIDRQRLPLSRLRRPAGLRLGLRGQPLATTARSPSTTGIRSTSRSTARRRRIRRIPTSCTAARAPTSRSTTGRPARPRASARTSRPRTRPAGRFNRNVRTMPLDWSPVNPDAALLRLERGLEDARRRQQLDAHQRRPHAADLGRAGERRASTRAP